MTDYEIFELLQKIDDGYIISEEDKNVILSVKEIVWKGTEKIPESIVSLTSLQTLDLRLRRSVP